MALFTGPSHCSNPRKIGNYISWIITYVNIAVILRVLEIMTILMAAVV